VSAAVVLISSKAAVAIILDCQQNLDGSYSCVEIGKPQPAHPVTPARDEESKIQREYIERAKEFCTYQKPRLRAGGKAASSAFKMEAMKSAQQDYERCLAAKAAELRNADQND
jgi:hypothetical protein